MGCAGAAQVCVKSTGVWAPECTDTKRRTRVRRLSEVCSMEHQKFALGCCRPQPMASTLLVKRGLTVATTVALMSGTVRERSMPGSGQTTEAANVEVHVTVAEKSGKLVRNLAPSDFELEDNGRRRTVLEVRPVSTPLDVVIAIDASASLRQRADLIGDVTERVLALLRPDDHVRVATFSERVGVLAGIPDQAALRGAFEAHKKAEGATALWGAMDAVLGMFSPHPRRRAIVLVSDGEDTSSVQSRDDVLARSIASDVTIHAIAVPSPPSLPSVRQRHQYGLQDLRILVEQTGGGYLLLTPELASGAPFGVIANELIGQYVLTFATERLDGKVHDLRVRVTRADATVRAKRKFKAPQPRGSSRP